MNGDLKAEVRYWSAITITVAFTIAAVSVAAFVIAVAIGGISALS